MIAPYLDADDRDWRTADGGTLAFALVGVGWWTTEHVIPAIEDAEFCETTVLVSGSPDKRERVREAHPGIEHAISYEAFVDGAASDAYDAVYVCTPNALHLPYVEAALDLGKDVLVEKPMEATVERARDLVAAADAADPTVMVAYRMQTEPAIRYARTLVREGEIGAPRLVHGQNAQRILSIIDDPDQWRLNPDLSGYGTSVMDLGIYPLNTARFVLDADPVAVQAAMRSTGEAFADVPDEVATFEVEYDDGSLAAFSSSQNAHQGTRFEVVGTEGRIVVEPAFHGRSSLSVSVGDRTVDFDRPGVDQMEVEFDYFANRVLADEPVYATAEHGLVDMLALRAIHEAAETGERTAVPSR